MKEKFVTQILSNMVANYSSNNMPDYLAGKSLFEEPNLILECQKCACVVCLSLSANSVSFNSFQARLEHIRV
jgi:hypothetical protein